MWASCPGDVGQDPQKLTLNVTYHVLERISPFMSFKVSGPSLCSSVLGGV